MQLLTTCQPMPSQSLNSDPPLPANSSQFIYWAWHHMVWNTALASLGQLPWLCPLPALVPLQPSCWLGMRSWKILDLVQKLLSNNWKYQCVTNVLLLLNPRHNTIPATRKKINSIPAETRTLTVPVACLLRCEHRSPALLVCRCLKTKLTALEWVTIGE